MARKVFSLLVIGNPKDIERYDCHLKVEPYIQYVFANRSKMRETAISAIEVILKDKNLNQVTRDGLRVRKNTIEHMSDFEYYQMVTDGLNYDNDGNALSTENPNGKWVTCQVDEKHYFPLILKEGHEKAYSALASEVDWEAMNNKEKEDLYRVTWELCMEGREPQNELEEQIKYNMTTTFESYEGYFDDFKNVDEYVTYNTAFFTSAVILNGEWDDSSEYDSKDWVLNYHNRFIANINGGETVTMFVFSTKEEDEQ